MFDVGTGGFESDVVGDADGTQHKNERQANSIFDDSTYIAS